MPQSQDALLRGTHLNEASHLSTAMYTCRPSGLVGNLAYLLVVRNDFVSWILVKAGFYSGFRSRKRENASKENSTIVEL